MAVAFMSVPVMYLSMKQEEHSPDDRILEVLEDGPATPDEIAKMLGTAWATAQGYLLKLAGAGKVVAIRKGRVNIYMLKQKSVTVPKIPPWARNRPLKELAEELESYFNPAVSAAEMIELERRQS